MPRHRFGQEAFHMDHLRSSPSQQHLDPTSRSSSSSQQDHDDLDGEMGAVGSAVGLVNTSGLSSNANGQNGAELLSPSGQRPHKLDLYSIPVFLLECLILGALGYAAYFIHFQYKLAPLLSGFYCDDISLRQSFRETKFTQQFIEPDYELVILVLLLVIPIVIIIFCELVNSMFGSLKFRQIRSLCKCCKLHSITRRTLRFSGAYLLGFLLVMISCDILATSAGKFHPYFAQECPAIYNECFKSAPNIPDSSQPFKLAPIRARDLNSMEQKQQNSFQSTTTTTTLSPSNPIETPAAGAANSTFAHPLSQPISSSSSSGLGVDSNALVEASGIRRTRRETTSPNALVEQQQQQQEQQIINKSVIERKWIDLTDANLKQLCQISGDQIQTRKFDLIAQSWPSFPGAIFTYACFYLACYLSFVGTARPFRLITSVLVMILLLAATIFNGQLVKEHYNHWEDVAGGATLSFVIVLFVLLVYLNKFRDTHYYENQKLYGSASKRQQQLHRSLIMMGLDGGGGGAAYKGGYSNELGQLDKVDAGGHYLSGASRGASAPMGQNLPNGNDINGGGIGGGPTSANDLAMRYFQIPRANYRGAPRPLSTVNRT